MRSRILSPLLLIALGFAACKQGDAVPGLPILACRPVAVVDSAGATQLLTTYENFTYDNKRRVVEASDVFSALIWKMSYGTGVVRMQAYRNDGSLNPYLGTKDIYLENGRIKTFYTEFLELRSALGLPLVHDTNTVTYSSEGLPIQLRLAGFAHDSVSGRTLKRLQITTYAYINGSLANTSIRTGDDTQSPYLTRTTEYAYAPSAPAIAYFPVGPQIIPGIPFAPILQMPSYRIERAYNQNGALTDTDTIHYRAAINEKGFITHLSSRSSKALASGATPIAADIQYNCD